MQLRQGQGRGLLAESRPAAWRRQLQKDGAQVSQAGS